MALIYEHWRPDTNECFYVGASRSAEDTRPYYYGPHNDDYDSVVSFLSESEIKPFTKLIWINLEDDCVGAYEKIRIAYQRAVLGDKLTNRANGGDGFNIDWNQERRESHSRLMKEHYLSNPDIYPDNSLLGKERWENPEFRGKMETIMSSEEYRDGQSVRMKNIWDTEDHQSKMKIIFESNEYITKQKESHSSYEAKDASVNAARSLWADDDFRATHTKRLSDISSTPEAREASSKRFTHLWQTVEFRMKMLTRSWWQSNVKNQRYWGA